MHCHNLLNTCDGSTQSLKGCIDKCEKDNKFWSASQFKCEDCPENAGCACDEMQQVVNLFSGKCEMECSLVKNAFPYS